MIFTANLRRNEAKTISENLVSRKALSRRNLRARNLSANFVQSNSQSIDCQRNIVKNRPPYANMTSTLIEICINWILKYLTHGNFIV